MALSNVGMLGVARAPPDAIVGHEGLESPCHPGGDSWNPHPGRRKKNSSVQGMHFKKISSCIERRALEQIPSQRK